MNIKKLIIIACFFVLLVGVMIVAGRLSIKANIIKDVSKVFGLPAEAGSVETGYLLTLKDLKIKNPEGFADDTMLDISEMTIDKNLGLIEVHVKKLLVEKSPTGRVNIDYLKPDPNALGDLKVKKFKMHLDKVVFKDEKLNKESTYDVNINKQYSNLPNAGSTSTIIVSEGIGDTNLPGDENINPPGDQPPGTEIPPGDQPPGDQPPGDQPPGGDEPGTNPPNPSWGGGWTE